MPLSEKALEARVRRAIAKDGERLRIPRSQAAWDSLGIHVVDQNNIVTAMHCSIKGLADEIGIN